MNNTFSLTPGSPGHCSCPLEEDLQLLLESPSARAASANFFSSHLGTLDPNTLNGAYDLLRSGSLGSPDFTRHLNMAGMFDSNHWPLSPAAGAAPHQPFGTLQPEMVLQQSEDQQLEGPAGTSSAVNGLHSPQQHQQRPQQQDHQPYAWHQQLQRGSDVAETGSNSPVRASTAGTGIAAVAPVAPVQLPPVVVQQLSEQQQQQQQKQLPRPVPVFDSNNRPGNLPVLRPLHIPGSAGAAGLSPKLAATATVSSPSAGAKQQRQQQQQVEHQPSTPRKQTPKQQRQQQNHAAESSPVDGSDQMHAAGVPGGMMAEQWHGTGDAAVDVKTVAGAGAGARVKQAGGGAAAPVAVAADALRAPGTLLWAKFPRFPWWPAMVITPTADVPQPPTSSSSTSSKGPILTRFLGTHDASWVDPDKALSPWGTNQSERSNKTKAAAFVAALKEANAYVSTGVLPDAFKSPPQLSVAPPPATKTKAKQAKPSTVASHGSQTPASRPAVATTDEEHRWQQPHPHSTDVWSLAVPSQAPGAAGGSAAQPGAAASLVPVSAVGSAAGTLPASFPAAAVDHADHAAPASAVAGAGSSSSSRQHKGPRGGAARGRAPAGPAAGLRSGDKRKQSDQASGMGSKRHRQQR